MAQDAFETLTKLVSRHEGRIRALETEADLQPVLHKISDSLSTMALMALHQSGVVDAVMDQDGKIEARILSDEERQARGAPTPRIVPGKTSTLMGDGGPLQWVLSPPAPFNDVEIVCSPDGDSPIGMRCYAVRKVIGGERQRYELFWVEPATIGKG